MKFKIFDEEFELDFLDADVMERIESIIDETQKKNLAQNYNGMTQSQAIRTQCGIIFDCLDQILGEGASNRIFKGRTNLKQTLLAFESLMLAKNRCNEEISELRDKYSPNRAQRRASQNHPQVRHQNFGKGGKRN